MTEPKKLKKFLCSVIMAVMTLSTIGSFSLTASADYDPCDVNHDEQVDLVDLVIISKYLNGEENCQNYNRLDVNKSLTIDKSDYNNIVAKNLNQTYSSSYFLRNNNSTGTNDGISVPYPNISGFTPNEVNNFNENRTYMRYSYQTHSAMTGYTLNYATNYSLSSSNSTTRSVIGLDERYIATGEENNGIVRLGVGGTGFIVGDHQIATAAHCLYDLSSDSWVSSMSIECYDNDGSLNSNYLTPVEAHIPYNFVYNWSLNNGTHTLYDYGLITVEEDLSDYVHFSLGTSYNVSAYAYYDIPIYVTGCPSSANNQSNSNNDLYCGEGRILGYNNLQLPNSESYNHYLLKYDVDMSGGDSGGPVYTITRNVINNSVSYTYTALGINTYEAGSYNFGTCITKYQLQFYNEATNTNMSY